MMRYLVILALTVVCVAGHAAQNSTLPGLGEDCTVFSSDEQQFASQLSSANRELFCEKFTPQQRDEAMQMAGQMNAQGIILTEDQAVTAVAKKNSIPYSGKRQKPSNSSCPID